MPTGAIKSALYLKDTVQVVTLPCCVCGSIHTFDLDRKDYDSWQAGKHIQNAFPEMPAGDREVLISGTCDPCFNLLFPPESEEDD